MKLPSSIPPLLAAAAAVVALGPGPSLLSPNAPSSAPRPTEPAPPVVEPTVVDPVDRGDGLERLVVVPRAGFAVPTVDASPAVDSVEPVEATTARSGGLPPLPQGATLVLRDGVLVARLPDGSYRALGGGDAVTSPSSTTPAPPSDAEADTTATDGDPVASGLARLDGVASVASIGDGSYAVALRDPSVLDGLDAEVHADPLLSILADPLESYQWPLRNTGDNLRTLPARPGRRGVADADIDAVEAHDVATGEGVVVAVIDSGVDFSHPDLSEARWSNPDEVCDNGVDDDGNGYVDDCHGWDFADDDATPFEPGAHPHGTHVAGIIAARADNAHGIVGIAPRASIMDLNVGATTPDGPSISGSALARAIRYAADNGADVINLSIGAPPGTSRSAMAPVESALTHAGDTGTLVVMAAGNDGVDLAAEPVWPASYEDDHLITVAASTPTDDTAPFSNHGGSVDLLAPGDLVLSSMPTDGTGDDFAFMSGTSQASAVVAGAAAVVLDAGGGTPPEAARQTLMGSADRPNGDDSEVGRGARLNIANAVGLGEPVVSFGDVRVTVAGLNGSVADADVRAELDIAVPDDRFDEPYEWGLALISLDGPDAHVVIEHRVVVDGAPVRTDRRGAVSLGLEGSGLVTWATRLPAGEYVLVLEAVPVDDPWVRLGDALTVRFQVGDTSTGAPDATPAPTTTASLVPPPGVPTRPLRDPVEPSAPPAISPSDPDGPTTTGAVPTTDGDPAPPTTVAPTTTWAAPSLDGDPAPPTTTTGAVAPADPAPDAGATPPPETSLSPSGAPPDAPPDSSPSASGAPPTTPSTAAPPSAAVDGGPRTPPEAGPVPSSEGADLSPLVSNGDWEVRSIRPGRAPLHTRSVVLIEGHFPAPAHVWFGDQAGELMSHTRNRIAVATPSRVTPATVDVTLRRSGEGIVATVPGGFTFGSPPQQTATPAGDGPAVVPDGDGVTTTVAVDRAAPATRPDVAPAGRPPLRRSRHAVSVVSTALDNGLQGARYGSSALFAAAPMCTASPCQMG